MYAQHCTQAHTGSESCPADTFFTLDKRRIDPLSACRNESERAAERVIVLPVPLPNTAPPMGDDIDGAELGSDVSMVCARNDRCPLRTGESGAINDGFGIACDAEEGDGAGDEEEAGGGVSSESARETSK